MLSRLRTRIIKLKNAVTGTGNMSEDKSQTEYLSAYKLVKERK